MKVYCNECKHFAESKYDIDCEHDNNITFEWSSSVIDRSRDNCMARKYINYVSNINRNNACSDFEKKNLWQRIKEVLR